MKRNYTELKRLARETLTGRFGTPMCGIVLCSLISNCLLLPFQFTLSDTVSQTIIFYIAAFIISMLSFLLSCGLCRLHLSMRRKKQYGILDIFYFFNHHPDRMISAYLCYFGIGLLIMAPAIILFAVAYYLSTTVLWITCIGVTLLCIVLCMTVLYRYAFVFYLMIDYPEMKVAAAFKESHHMMKQKKMRFFLLQLSFIGWFVLGIFSFGIGFLWIEPYFEQTQISFYFELNGETDRLQAASRVSSDETHFQAYC